jgi:hypothetical protein
VSNNSFKFVTRPCISKERPASKTCPVESGQSVSPNKTWEVESPTSITGTRRLAICSVCGTTSSVETESGTQ